LLASNGKPERCLGGVSDGTAARKASRAKPLITSPTLMPHCLAKARAASKTSSSNDKVVRISHRASNITLAMSSNRLSREAMIKQRS